MNSIFRLIGLDLSDLKRRSIWMVAGGITAAAFAIMTLGFLGVALYVTLLEQMAPLQSALIVAGVAFVLAIVTMLISMRMARGSRSEMNAAMRTSAITALSPTMVRLAARHTGVVGAIAVTVAILAYLEGRRK